jgi:hypothetical protein
LQFFAADNSDSAVFTTKDIITAATAFNAEAIYCDRGLANKIRKEAGARFRLSLEPTLFGDDKQALPMRIKLDAATAFIVNKEDTELCRRVLDAANISMREVEMGRLTMFEFTPELRQKRYAAADSLIWRGFAPLLDLNTNEIKKPGICLNAEFDGDLLLTGITLSPVDLTPGTTMQIKLLWEIPAPVSNIDLAVFMHFKHNGKTIFQGDHPFAPHITGRFSDNMGFYAVELQQITIPENAPTGNYTVEMGLYRREPPHKRLHVSSQRKTKKDSIIIPLN